MIEHNNVVACVGGGKTKLEMRPVSAPGTGEILLRLRVVGFCGTDMFKLDTDSAAKGTVLGHEIVGEVIELGDGVANFSTGDRVVVPHHVPCGTCVLCRRGNETMCETFRENLMDPGGFADTVLIRSRATEFAAHALPDGVADEQAVFMEPAACVLRGIRRAGIDDTGVAAILGGGSMGLLHLLVLKAVLPEVKIVVVDPVAERRELAATLGAAAAVEPGSGTAQAVDRLSDGIGADAVFDTVGGAGMLAAGLELTRPGGSVVLFAHAPEGEASGFDLNNLFKHERRIIGTYSGSVAEQTEILQLILTGALDPSPLVTHKLPLNDFDRAVSLVKQRQALKILFTPSLDTEDG